MTEVDLSMTDNGGILVGALVALAGNGVLFWFISFSCMFVVVFVATRESRLSHTFLLELCICVC